MNDRNKKRIKNIETEFLNAKKMDELQKDILEIFREKSIVRQKILTDDVEELQTSLVPFEDLTVYYNRNNDLLIDARVQVETIEEATELVERLKIDEIPDEKVTEEGLEELEKLVNHIKDEVIKENLLEQIENFRLALSEVDEDKLAIDEVEELEEEEIEEPLEEETIETVQETNSKTEKTSDQNNTSVVKNNNRTETSQLNKKPNSPSKSQSNNSSKDQSNNQSGTTEQKIVVAKQYQETAVIEEIPYETIVYENKNIAAGEEIVYRQGSRGTVIETHEVTVYTDGTSNKKLISSDRTEPVNRVVTVGTKED